MAYNQWFIIVFPIIFGVSALAQDSGAPWDVDVTGRRNSPISTRGSANVVSKHVTGVTVYTEPFCDPCKQVTKFLKDNNIKYQEEDADSIIDSFLGLARSHSDPPKVIIDYSDGTNRTISGGADIGLLRMLLLGDNIGSNKGNPDKDSGFNLEQNSDDTFDVGADSSPGEVNQ